MKEVDKCTVIKRIIVRNGSVAQTNQAIEEMAELIVAINHYRRGRCMSDEVIEEIADVLIMMHQLALIFSEKAVMQKVEEKMQRLVEQLE